MYQSFNDLYMNLYLFQNVLHIFYQAKFKSTAWEILSTFCGLKIHEFYLIISSDLTCSVVGGGYYIHGGAHFF